jgi:uncharacterized metal-binding protein YceD (DUF177 family)
LKLVNQYIIPFTGLKEGEHVFNFDFREEFFKKYDVLEAIGGEVKAEVFLLKKPNMLRLENQLRGNLKVQCDRCLELFSYPLFYSGSLIVKFGLNAEDSTDEIWVLNPDENEIDLEQYFYECISLSLPIQIIHPDTPAGNSGCNPEMLNILETQINITSGKNKESDPRWDKLKDLLNNT